MKAKVAEKQCFVMAPIGDKGSDIRKRSDEVLNNIIKPIVEDCGYKAIRADELDEPGIITAQIIQHIIEDDLVIADLTDENPNVFYELAVRHITKKPYIQISQSKFPLPFDVAPVRTIFFQASDRDSIECCKRDLEKQIKAIEQNTTGCDSPISVAIELLQLRGSDNLLEKSNASIMSMLQDLRGELVITLREQSERISKLQTWSNTQTKLWMNLLEILLKNMNGKILKHALAPLIVSIW